MPRAQRSAPPYIQIADHYRGEITSGRLAPGTRLPAITAIAAEWGVAAATAAKAVGLLQVEDLIYSSPQGSFVADPRATVGAPRDRIIAAGPAFRQPGTAGDTITVNAAGSVPAPNYVADVLGVDPGTLIIRREEIASHGPHVRALTVDWIPAADVMEISGLTDPEPVPGGPETLIASITGRRVTHGRDYLRGRACDAREADALRIAVGAPILAGAHVWTDDDGAVVLYGEWCLPPDHVVSYPYAVERPDDAGPA